VTDKNGGKTTATTSVVVSSPTSAPVANAGLDRTTSEGTSLAFTGTVTGGSNPMTYLWTWGDGTTSNTQNPSHAFPDNGTYTVTFKVTDAQSRTSQDTMVVTVSNVAPTVSAGGPYNSAPGTAITFNPTVTDPGVNDALTYAWNFGDGTTSTQKNPV